MHTQANDQNISMLEQMHFEVRFFKFLHRLGVPNVNKTHWDGLFE